MNYTPRTLREFAEKLRLVEAASHSEAAQLAATRRMLEGAADAQEQLEQEFSIDHSIMTARLAEADGQHESKMLDAQEESYNDGYAEAQRQSQATIDHWRTLYEDAQEQARQLVDSANKRTERIRHLWYAVSDGDMDRLSATYALKDLL